MDNSASDVIYIDCDDNKNNVILTTNEQRENDDRKTQSQIHSLAHSTSVPHYSLLGSQPNITYYNYDATSLNKDVSRDITNQNTEQQCDKSEVGIGRDSRHFTNVQNRFLTQPVADTRAAHASQSTCNKINVQVHVHLYNTQPTLSHNSLAAHSQFVPNSYGQQNVGIHFNYGNKSFDSNRNYACAGDFASNSVCGREQSTKVENTDTGREEMSADLMRPDDVIESFNNVTVPKDDVTCVTSKQDDEDDANQPDTSILDPEEHLRCNGADDVTQFPTQQTPIERNLNMQTTESSATTFTCTSCARLFNIRMALKQHEKKCSARKRHLLDDVIAPQNTTNDVRKANTNQSVCNITHSDTEHANSGMQQSLVKENKQMEVKQTRARVKTAETFTVAPSRALDKFSFLASTHAPLRAPSRTATRASLQTASQAPQRAQVPWRVPSQGQARSQSQAPTRASSDTLPRAPSQALSQAPSKYQSGAPTRPSLRAPSQASSKFQSAAPSRPLSLADTERAKSGAQRTRGRAKVQFRKKSLRSFGVMPAVTRHCIKKPIQADKHIKTKSKRCAGATQYSCQYCAKSFTRRGHRNEHELIHTEEMLYACDYCSKRFTYKDQRDRHKRIHTGEKPHSCQYCTKRFIDKYSKAVHERIHTGEKPHVCQYCSHRFAQQSAKNQHEKIHTGEKPHACKFCSKRYPRKSQKDIHERIHTGEKPYACQYCTKRFTQQPHKIQHERLHTGEKPYACNYCSKRFIHKGHRDIHERIHTGEKPHVCQYCPKRFTNQSDKKHHERIHTGEKPYVCKYCLKKFTHRCNKNTHERRCCLASSSK